MVIISNFKIKLFCCQEAFCARKGIFCWPMSMWGLKDEVGEELFCFYPTEKPKLCSGELSWVRVSHYSEQWAGIIGIWGSHRRTNGSSSELMWNRTSCWYVQPVSVKWASTGELVTPLPGTWQIAQALNSQQVIYGLGICLYSKWKEIWMTLNIEKELATEY